MQTVQKCHRTERAGGDVVCSSLINDLSYHIYIILYLKTLILTVIIIESSKILLF